MWRRRRNCAPARRKPTDVEKHREALIARQNEIPGKLGLMKKIRWLSGDDADDMLGEVCCDSRWGVWMGRCDALRSPMSLEWSGGVNFWESGVRLGRRQSTRLNSGCVMFKPDGNAVAEGCAVRVRDAQRVKATEQKEECAHKWPVRGR